MSSDEDIKKLITNIQTESDNKIQMLLDKLQETEKIFNTTIGILRQQRDYANDQIVQHLVHIQQLTENEVELKKHLLDANKKLQSFEMHSKSYPVD